MTVAADATATTRSSAVLLRLRLIAAARLVALVATVPDVWKFRPVFEPADAVKVKVTAAPPVGVIVIAVVCPAVGAAVNVPTTFARPFPVDALMGKTAKSAVQLGVAFTSNVYLAGDMPGATPPTPNDTAQSLSIWCLARVGRCGRLRTSPGPSGSWPCDSHPA